MRIAEIICLQVVGGADLAQDSGRGVDALDLYPEFAAQAWVEGRAGQGRRRLELIYLRIRTDQGPEGIHGPITREQAQVIRQLFAPFLLGRDPLPANLVWDQLFRLERHARSGLAMTAISALDNAMWDIRGKFHGVPVHRLLGGPTRERIPVYPTSYPDLDPARVAGRARELVAQGFLHQKWFFRFGPGDGRRGIEANLAMAAAVREAVGDRIGLMFDCRRSWDVQYAAEMLREIEPLRPFWIEEPLPACHLDGHRRLRQATRLPIASGEHLYTRWEVKPFCDEALVDYLQVDPEWCGGLTELMKIAHLAESASIKVAPHGRLVAPAVHFAAAVPPSVCPLVEYIVSGHGPAMQCFHRDPILPQDGHFPLPTSPGMGIALDPAKVDRIEVLP
jgi:L-rhamnonate dehydratase